MRETDVLACEMSTLFPSVLGSEAWLAYKLILASATFAHFLCSLYHQLIFSSLELKSGHTDVGVLEWSICLFVPFFFVFSRTHFSQIVSLTIIPRARMGSKSIVYEAEGRMGYWLRGCEGERNNCFSKFQLVGQKNIDTKHLSRVKARHQSFLPPKHYKYGSAFHY